MPPEDVRHLWRGQAAASGGTDDFGGFAEVRGPHDCRGNDAKLFHVSLPKLSKRWARAAGDAEGLPGTHLDRCAVHRPSQDALTP